MRNANLANNPRLEQAILRLKQGPAKDDFAILTDALAAFGKLADRDALKTLGPMGDVMRGVSRGYQAVNDLFAGAGNQDPPPPQAGAEP